MLKIILYFYGCNHITMNKFVYLFLLITTLSFGQLSFENNASLLGVDVSYGDSTYGGGVSFYDFDGDGWDDITYSTTNGQKVIFFKNNEGTFNQIDLGINSTTRTKQVVWVDYDNDGDKDFFATSISNFNKFYRNDGNMTFTDITSTCGLFIQNLYTYGASFGDIDNDGDLDVFIANRDDITENQRSYLYRNDNGFFVDITQSAGLSLNNELAFCAAFFDYDNDGDQDIYVANDKLPNINRLYRNNNDLTFTDVSVSSGAGIAIDAMSTTIGDYNNDGWFDIYVSNSTDGNYHLKNNQDGTFTNVASITGTAFYSFAWGATFLDADNDSDLDLYVSSMFDGSNSLLSAAFYENQGDHTYAIPSNIGFENDTRMSYSNAIGDFNNDGLPDIIVMNDTENNYLWENTTTNSNNWLKVNLKGTVSNKDGIGSRIEVFANGKSQFRYTLCGEGYLGQNSNSELFGLKDATSIDYVKVTWLSGIEDFITNIDVNKSITVVESEGVLSTNNIQFNEFKVFPNPTNDNVSIILKQLNANERLQIYDVFGRNLKTQHITRLNTTINLENFAEGVYFFKIESGTNTTTKKIMYNKN